MSKHLLCDRSNHLLSHLTQKIHLKVVLSLWGVLYTVHRLISKGKIQPLKIGRAVRIPEESLKEYIDQNMSGSGEEDTNEVWNDKEHLHKRRFSLQGIIKGGEPITEEAIDEVIKEWERE